MGRKRSSVFSPPSVNIIPYASNTDLTLVFCDFEMNVSFSPLHPL